MEKSQGNRGKYFAFPPTNSKYKTFFEKVFTNEVNCDKMKPLDSEYQDQFERNTT